jgi:hypothetical protein
MIREIKEFFIRGKRGWAPSDTWSLDAYLSKVIYESLLYLQKTQCGYPITIKMSDPNNEYELHLNKCNWDILLMKMINAFKLAKEIGEGTREHYFSHADKQTNQTLNCLTKKEERDMKEGMKLFITYYFSLWD